MYMYICGSLNMYSLCNLYFITVIVYSKPHIYFANSIQCCIYTRIYTFPILLHSLDVYVLAKSWERFFDFCLELLNRNDVYWWCISCSYRLCWLVPKIYFRTMNRKTDNYVYAVFVCCDCVLEMEIFSWRLLNEFMSNHLIYE